MTAGDARKPRPVPGHAHVIRGSDGRIHGKEHTQGQPQFQYSVIPDQLQIT
jgi:hypothetical protein